MTDQIIPLQDAVRKVIEDPARRHVLTALDVLDSEPDPDFDRLTRITARVFGAQFAQVTLLDTKRQWFRACFGVENVSEIAVDVSFCAHTIAALDQDHLFVPDTLLDERFKTNPFVTGQPGVRFYAGAPVIVHGQRIGTLCVLGTEPRESLDPDMVAQLIDMAELAATLFSLKDEARVRAHTAAALIQEEWRHALTLEAGKVGSWVWDTRTGEVSCNDMFRRMYGLPEVGVIRFQQVLDAHDPRDRSVVENGIAASFADGSDYNAAVRVKGSGRWLTMRGRVFQRDAEGKPLIMMGASLDISESKKSAEQTQLLLLELNHRVKNTLAMIQSVARQTIKQNPDPQQFVDAFSGRLRTISDAHVLLADRDWSGVQLYDVLNSQLSDAFIDEPDRVDMNGEDLTLPADHALGLGLILHELTTNAYHYGALSNAEGMVCINWEVLDAPAHGLSIHWRELGGPEVVSTGETGLGVQLIERSLAKVLDSEVKLRFDRDGVAADIWMPLPLH